MPLSHGKTQKSIGKNIETEEKAGKPHDQSIAIALNTAREAGAHIPEPKMASGGVPHVTFMEDESPDEVKETTHLAQPTDTEKRALVEKAIRERTLKLDNGGIVDPSQLPSGPLPADATQPNKLQAILQAIGMAGKQAVAPISSLMHATQAATAPVASAVAPAVVPAMNSVLGTNIPSPQSLPAPAPLPQPVSSVPSGNVPPQVTNTIQSKQPAAASAPDPLAQLGKSDPTAIAPGLQPQDRQDLANQLQNGQHSVGNLLAEAMSGIGDALAARGGVQQNSLGSIIALQKQQRDEALGNFDKARDFAVQNYTLKNQADQELINNVKAHSDFISPQIAQSLGHPEWANKPSAQVGMILSAQKNMLDYQNNLMQRRQGALKDSADAYDQAAKSGGIFGTQKMMDPQSRLTAIYNNAVANDPEAFGGSARKTGK